MDESGALQGMSGPLAAQITMRQVAHFVVNQRHERLQRILVARSPSDEQFGNRGRSGVVQETGSSYGIPQSMPKCGQNIHARGLSQDNSGVSRWDWPGAGKYFSYL
jgi:hypothetical protein